MDTINKKHLNNLPSLLIKIVTSIYLKILEISELNDNKSIQSNFLIPTYRFYYTGITTFTSYKNKERELTRPFSPVNSLDVNELLKIIRK